MVFAPSEYAALKQLAWEEWILDPKLLERAIGELYAGGYECRGPGGLQWRGALSEPVAEALCAMLKRTGSLAVGSDCSSLAGP